MSNVLYLVGMEMYSLGPAMILDTFVLINITTATCHTSHTQVKCDQMHRRPQPPEFLTVL